jgi:two-component system response regulator
MKNIDYLLIEDNPNDAELIVRGLKKIINTENLLILEDGEKAINYLFNNENVSVENCKLKVIFLDLKLPKISGLEVLKEIKSNIKFQKIPVVVLTSSKEDYDIKTAYNLGANSYIVKPMDYESFISTIASIGKYWILMNETLS